MNLLTDGIKSKAVMLTQGTKKLSIDNHTQVYPVYKIRLDQLYFLMTRMIVLRLGLVSIRLNM